MLLLQAPGSRAAWVPPVFWSAPQRTTRASVCTLPLRFPLFTLPITIPTKLTISDTLNLSPLFSLFTCLRFAPPPQNSHKPHTCTHALLYRPSPGDDASAGDRSFLGLLCPIGEYKVYGYTTITQVKIIIIMRDDFDRVNDTDVRGVRSIAKLCA